MATRRSVYDALKARLIAQWPPRTETLIWENDGQQIPSGNHVQVFVEWDDEPITAFGGGLGSNTWRARGVIRAEIKVTKASGMADALDMADAFFAAFRGYQANDTIITGTMGPVSDDTPQTQGRFWLASAAVMFSAHITG